MAPTAEPPLPHLEEAASATDRFIDTVAGLTDEELRAPSLLPGWTRGHVVTHVARNADGMRNLLVWARTGVETPQYPSWEQRDADIDSGAGRSVEEQRRDVVDSAARLRAEVDRLEPAHWEVPVRTISSDRTFPARDVLRSRRTEVEVHHADLGVAYSPADWPEDFVRTLIARVQDDRAEGPPMVLCSTDVEGLWKFGRGAGPEITGPAWALAWWLVGRSDGGELTSSTGQLPRLSRWR